MVCLVSWTKFISCFENKTFMPKKIVKENHPSDEIAEYIKITNLFPKCELKGLIGFVESVDLPEAVKVALSDENNSFIKILESAGYVDQWLETIKPFPDLYLELTEHPPHIERLPTSSLIYRFQTFDHIRQVTNQVADVSEAQRRNGAFNGSLPWAAWAVDGGGKLFISTSRIAEAFVGCDYARIKRCANCGKIIWAYRLNRNYCDKKCLNGFHQKKIRRDPKRNREVNERRKNNRKGIKDGTTKLTKRIKNNGTL